MTLTKDLQAVPRTIHYGHRAEHQAIYDAEREQRVAGLVADNSGCAGCRVRCKPSLCPMENLS